MDYKTERSRNLVWQCHVTGTVTITFDNRPTHTLPNPTIKPSLTGKVSANSLFAGFIVEGSYVIVYPPGGTMDSFSDYTGQVVLKVTLTPGGAMTTIVLNSAAVPYGSVVTVTGSVDGIITSSVQVEEWVDVTFDPFPIGMSDAIQRAVDPPTPCTVRFYEKIVPSSTMSISGFGLSESYTFSDTPPEVGYEIQTDIQVSAFDDSGSWSAYSTMGGVALEAPIYYSDSSGSHGDGQTLSVLAPVGSPASRTMISTIQPPKSYTLDGRVMAMHQPYPTALNAEIVDHTDNDGNPITTTVPISGGSFSKSYTQHSYTVQSTFPGDTTIHKLQEFSSVRCKLQAASLAAAGEIVANDQLSFRGWTWTGCTINQASSQDVDATPSASNWTAAGTHTTVSGSSPLTIAVSSGGMGGVTSTLGQAPASLRGGSWTGTDLSGFRYLQFILNHTSGSSSPFTVTIGGKTWTHDLNGQTLKTGSTAILLDLCAPDGHAGDTDATDTQWQWNTGFTTNSDGWAYGCHNVTGISITGLTANQNYSLGALSLQRLNHATLTTLPVYGDWVQAYEEASVGENTTTTYYRRGHEGDTDGAQSLEWTDYVWTHTESGSASSDSYSPITIADMVRRWNLGDNLPHCGWTASTGIADPHDGGNLLRNNFLNDSLWSGYLRGAGLFYGGSWQTGMDGALGAITAQFLSEVFDWYPGAGDCFGSGGYTSGTIPATPLHCGTVLRGAPIGIVVDSNGKSVSGTTVQLLQSGMAQGTGLTDSYGQYASMSHPDTGSPFGVGGQIYDVKALVGMTPPHVSVTLPPRYRHRTCLRVVAVTTQLPCVADWFAGVLTCAWADVDGALQVACCASPAHFDMSGVPTRAFEDKQTLESGPVSALGVVYLPNGRCYLSYTLGGNIYYRTSDALGLMNWSSTSAPSPATSDIPGYGRGLYQAFRVSNEGTDMATGAVQLSWSRNVVGDVWQANMAQPSDAIGPHLGACWTGNQLVILTTDGSGHVQQVTTQAVDSLSSPTDTGMTGKVLTLTSLKKGVMVALLGDGGSSVGTYRSTDGGQTWGKIGTLDTADLMNPPVLATDGNALFACWIQDATPTFRLSLDAGVTWW